MERESYEKVPSYPPSSSMEMETLMKRPEVTLADTKNVDKWKTKVINMLKSKFASIISKSFSHLTGPKSVTMHSSCQRKNSWRSQGPSAPR